MDTLQSIIRKTSGTPNIVNEKSNYVVVTYWWGKNNLNKNIARPCVDFYESILMEPFKILQSQDISLHELDADFDWLHWFNMSNNLKVFYDKMTKKYLNESKRPQDEFESVNKQILNVVQRAFIVAKPFIYNLISSSQAAKLFKEDYEATKDNPNINKKQILEEFKVLIATRDKVLSLIKQNIRDFIRELESFLQYKMPITYDEMIRKWENQCANVKCNYLAIEYPEFAMKGGYQMAINAKPLFIQKALELCKPRNILYIDGDMNMNFYAPIFDLADIDFMGRNWNMDPRGSQKYLEGDIMVDPYSFETSGGIMFFSQSPESQRLLSSWIEETAKPYQQGKADDRIISLIFNSKRLLAPMKVLYLPVEYLWLTLWYDDFIEPKVSERIYVEHPECLTSEDTATSSGASSSRTPKFYQSIEYESYPRSENLYESVMFPNRDVAETFRPWLNYLGDAIYTEAVGIDELVGEQPFYVHPYNDFGKKNSIVERNIAAVSALSTINAPSTVILNKESFTPVQVVKFLQDGKDVIYYPDTTSDSYSAALNAIRRDTTKSRLELVFADTGTGRVNPHNIYLYTIDLTQPIYIRHGNPLLQTMFLLLDNMEELSNFFHANFQFLSRIRIHVLKKPRVGGGTGENSRDTNDATEFMYGPLVGGKLRRTYKKKLTRNRSRRNRRKNV
jgi:hypothetical protein